MKLKALSLCFTLSICLYATADDKIIDYNDCPSGELSVILNKNNEAPKKEIIRGLKAIGSYRDLQARQINAESDNPEIHFRVEPVSCETDDYTGMCSEPRSWGDIQWRLKTIKATEVTCAEPEESKQEQEQEQKPEDDPNGGVTGENGS